MSLRYPRPTMYVGTACACLLLPALFSTAQPNFVHVLTSYKVSLTMGAVGLFVWELKGRLDARAPVIGLLGGAFVAMVTYSMVSRSDSLPFDFQAYLHAAQAIRAGTNPYQPRKGGYLYPPLLAQSVNALRAGIDKVASAVDMPRTKHAKGQPSPIFSLWCGLELVGAVLVYVLGQQLAKRLGADELQAATLPSVLLLANHAFWRTLLNGQINLLLTTIFLVAILCAARRQLVSGMAVAIGAHIKVYPMFLLGAWTLAGRWRITAYALLCFGLIFALQLTFFDASLWHNYVHFAARAPQQVRDESLATVSLISYTFGDGRAIAFRSGTPAAHIAMAAYAVILVIMAARFVQRELIWRTQHEALESSIAAAIEDKFRIMGHANDAVVLPLLISPIVWNHHYVVLIPVLIWSTLIRGFNRLRSWLPVAVLLFPYFVNPFIYVYYAGVWLWLYDTAPRAIWNALTASGERAAVPDAVVPAVQAPSAS